MLSQIFPDKPADDIHQAVRRANGSVSMAAEELLSEAEGKLNTYYTICIVDVNIDCNN